MSEGCIKLRAANGTSLRRYTSRLGTGSMTFRGDLYIRRVVAAGTGIISVPADLRTSSRLCLMVLQIMTEGRSKLRTADRTSLRRQARCSRTRRMTLCRDLLIRRIVAAGTSIVSIPTDFRTSSCLCLMVLQIMPEGRNKLRTADRTNLRSRTGSRRAGDMTARGGNNFTANRANLVFRTRRVGTKRMTVRGNALCTFLIASAARRSLYAFFCTSRGSRLHVLAPIMTEGGNFFLRFDDGVTTAAMDAFGFPRSRTRRRYRLIDDLDMSESIDIPRLRFPAARAFGRLDTLFRASRRFRLRIFAPIMTEGGNFFLRFDDGVTTAAMNAFGFPRSRTRCRYRLIDNLEMPKSFDFPRLRFPAACAFGRLNAFFRTSRSFRLSICTPIMTESGNFLLRLDDSVTAAAMRTVRQTRLRTRCRNGGIGHGSVTQCRNRS